MGEKMKRERRGREKGERKDERKVAYGFVSFFFFFTAFTLTMIKM